MSSTVSFDNCMKRASWAEISESEETQPVSNSDMEDHSGSSHFHKVVQSLERKRPSAEIRAPSKNYWAKKYHQLLADYEDQHDELDDVHEELHELRSILDDERARSRRIKSTNNDMKRDLKSLIKEREGLYDECLKMKALLKSRNADIESLVAQVNLLIQVGSIKKSDNASPEARTSTTSPGRRSGVMTNIKKELASRVTDNIKKKSAMDNLKMELTSFFSAKKPTNAEELNLSRNQARRRSTKLPEQRGRCKSEDLDYEFADGGSESGDGRIKRNSFTLPRKEAVSSPTGTTASFWKS